MLLETTMLSDVSSDSLRCFFVVLLSRMVLNRFGKEPRTTSRTYGRSLGHVFCVNSSKSIIIWRSKVNVYSSERLEFQEAGVEWRCSSLIRVAECLGLTLDCAWLKGWEEAVVKTCSVATCSASSSKLGFFSISYLPLSSESNVELTEILS